MVVLAVVVAAAVAFASFASCMESWEALEIVGMAWFDCSRDGIEMIGSVGTVHIAAAAAVVVTGGDGGDGGGKEDDAVEKVDR